MSHKAQTQNDMCVACGMRPKYVEHGYQHPYCGRTCAKRAQQSGTSTCRLRGCPVAGRTAFVGFCSEYHASEAVRSQQVKGCIQCNDRPATTGNLCPVCDRRSKDEPVLEELDPRGNAFKNLANTTVHKWSSSNGGVKIEKVFKVVNSQATQDRFEANSQKLISAGSMEMLRTYHSSQCICNLGYLDNKICDRPSCGICSILKSSFKSFAFGDQFNTGRYGKGIYSYLNPARADRHSTSCMSSPYRVMISCDVAMTKAAKSWLPQMRVTSLSDEDGVVFVNNPDAIIAKHVILYKY